MRLIRSWLTDREGPPLRDLLFLFIIFGFSFFQSLGRIPLIDPDEGRYAEIPREMLERGDFVTPLLNYVKYFEKPPLHYWLNAAAMSIFGRNEFAARISGALMGLLAVLLVYHVGRRLFGRRSGLFAALILGTCTGFLVQARLDITDMSLTTTLSAALAFFVVASREGERHPGRYYYLSYFCAALAVLAKGLIGIVFPGAIIFLYMLFTRRWRLLKEMRLPTGMLLFFAVSAPWFVMISLRNPEFARFFFIHEHFERFTTTVHGRYEPFWFFIPVLLGTMLPWSLFIPACFRGVWKGRTTPKGDARFYLLTWAVFIFLFFSKSDSKLVPYILPVFPPLALLLGDVLSGALDTGFRPLRLQSWIAGFVTAILGAGIIIYPHLAPGPAFGAVDAAVIGGLFLAEGVAVLVCTRREKVLTLLATLSLCSYLLGIAAPPVILGGVAEHKSPREFAQIIREQGGAMRSSQPSEFPRGSPSTRSGGWSW